MFSVLSVFSAAARAQTGPAPVTETTISDRRELTNGQKDVHFVGHVEMKLDNTEVYADDVRYHDEGNRAIATGNVTFTQGENRLSAERAEFNTETRLGTFYNAWGMARVEQSQQRPSSGGVAPPPMTGEQTYVYFFGEKIEKIGPKKYKITNGGFSTCVQPTPRWNLEAGTVILNIDHYTLLKQAVFNVKGVPMFYVPILYYPTKREGRATGFLIPTYGSSTTKGQTLHNAFFWAINRSQDATITHDWFSKTGQGVGSEYRYNYGAGSDGNIRAQFLNEHAATYVLDNGTTRSSPALRSYRITGGANQMLPFNLRARASANYFSSLAANQTYNTNIGIASQNQRDFGGNIVGAWGTYSLNGTLDYREYFYGLDHSVVSGNWPRVTLSRNERPLVGDQLYFSLGTDFAHLVNKTRPPGTSEQDFSVTRLDVLPQIRYPFKKWQWLTANTTFSWRDTYYTRSLAPADTPQVLTPLVDADVNRRYFTIQSQLIGPVFNRIWNTPGNGYAEKFKHTIEPFFTVQRVSSVDNFNRIPQSGGDVEYGGRTRYSYGVNNRFYAKRRTTSNTPATAREFISVELSQFYYTDARAARYDRECQTCQLSTTATKFGPISLNVGATPSNDVNASVRAEFDSRYHDLRTISAQTTYSWSGRLQTTGSWSKSAFIDPLTGLSDPQFRNQSLNVSTSAHTRNNRFGGAYSVYYDVYQKFIRNQRMTGFYNAQCCGIAFEYDTANYTGSAYSTLPGDHRFFMSFTLAGLGNFSPFNGALGGVPR